MIRLIKFSDYKTMPWKNQQGTTLEIDISPNADPFLWRLSAAKISGSNLFSEYRGYDRLLAIWQGEGLLFNDDRLLPKNIFQFKGEDTIDCKPLDGDVIDVGLIYSRQHLTAKMEFQTHKQNKILHFTSDLTFLFCLEGYGQIFDLKIQPGDTLKIEDEYSLEIQVTDGLFKLIQIDLIFK